MKTFDLKISIKEMLNTFVIGSVFAFWGLIAVTLYVLTEDIEYGPEWAISATAEPHANTELKAQDDVSRYTKLGVLKVSATEPQANTELKAQDGYTALGVKRPILNRQLCSDPILGCLGLQPEPKEALDAKKTIKHHH